MGCDMEVFGVMFERRADPRIFRADSWRHRLLTRALHTAICLISQPDSPRDEAGSSDMLDYCDRSYFYPLYTDTRESPLEEI